jgi:pectate lyase
LALVFGSLLVGGASIAGSPRVPLAGFPVYGPAGATTRGGRGRPTVLVRNTNDRGAGSLRDAVTCPGGCTISCAGLAGTIRLESQIEIRQSWITIDCSDAKPPGVQITGEANDGGALIQVAADNVILRYLRVRGAAATCGPANNRQCDIDMINIVDADDVVLDHVSLTGATDGLLDVVGSHARLTVQNSILSRPAYAGDDPQLTVSLLGDLHGVTLSGVTWYRNLFSTYGDRAPSIQASSPSVSSVMLVENVFYDFVYAVRMAQSDPRGSLYVDAVRNVFKRGPGGRSTPFLDHEKLPIYVRDAENAGKVFVAGDNALIDNGSRLWSQLWPVTYGPHDAFALEVSSHPNGIPTTACNIAPCAQRTQTTNLYWLYPTLPITPSMVTAMVLPAVGASRPTRDWLDAQIVNDVVTGTRSVPFPPGNPTLPNLTP